MTNAQMIAKVLYSLSDRDKIWDRIAKKAGVFKYWKQFAFRDFCPTPDLFTDKNMAKRWWRQQKVFLMPFKKELLKIWKKEI